MNLLIVDDHSVIRDGVRRLLSSNPDISVSEASSSGSALAVFRSQRPDIVLLDLNLGNSSGLELLRRLLGEDIGARVLIFSMYSQPINVLRGLKAGARGYVSKSADLDELLAAIRCVADGGQYVEQEIALHQRLANPLERLTVRELDIIRLLEEGKSLSMIADAMGVAYRAVASACDLIKGKLGLQRTADLIRLTFEMRQR
jgi:two-component system, NarL family, invasion response regulator UvrY